MTFLRSVVRSGVPAVALAICALTGARDADACGGCFHPAADTGGSVVTDHRMVFEITSKETILWDQVRYAGDPKEFAWVLPVRPGARIELSRDEWISALDAATRTTVQGPTVNCPPPVVATSKSGSTSSSSSSTSSSSSSSSSSSGGAGCGGGGGGGYSGASESAPGLGSGGTTDDGSGDGTTPMFTGNDDVEIVAQSSIGPYQAVTIRASGTSGIAEWLTSNGFVIPASIAPVIDAYTLQKLDFIALRLRPNQGTRSMRPVRIVTPGADTTLPLRMVAAGVGAKVGLTLWVIGEGRYHTQNFPDAPIDWSSLAWNVTAGRSNRTDLEAAALATGGGRAWITEASIRSSFTVSKYGSGLPNVFDAYMQQCQLRPKRVVPCDESALPPADGKPEDVVSTDPDAGSADEDGGAGDADAEADAGADGGASDGGIACTKVVKGCDGFDDLEVAARSLHVGDSWVTRLRADLPVGALATDLQLGATSDQSELSPTHKTTKFTDPTFDPCAAIKARNAAVEAANKADQSRYTGGDGCTCRSARLNDGLGTWILIGLTIAAVPFVARRRRNRK